MTTETMNFSADVSRLLDIVANALYTNQDVFLRELISNAADACDRLRYEAIQNPALTKDNAQFAIHIYNEPRSRLLVVVDNGIGMGREELVENLGTIAKSGSAALMQSVNEGKTGADKLKLIGQFGVGFYATYMVADAVTVVSRKAGSPDIWAWESDGRTGFNVRTATPDEAARLNGARGTAIIAHIKDSASEFLIDEKIKQTIEAYSDHIDIPVFLARPEHAVSGFTPVNQASALWVRPKSEITPEQYTQFYRHITHGFDEPLMTSHWRAEGKIEYSALMFVPMMRPWDLYDPTRKSAVKLYVRRVFISDKLDSLMYPWLRFVRGVIDSEDLPLNISRESLQHNPLITKIRSGVAKKILSDLAKLVTDDYPAFITFWGQFGAAIKEGLYDAPEHREDIFKICRFFSTHDEGEKFVSLDDYISRMKDGQKDIYYISGEKLDSLKSAPQIEGFKAKGYEVLFFTDTIDDFWLQSAADFKGKTFKSVTKGDIDLGDVSSTETKNDAAVEGFLEKLKTVLKDEVDDVRASTRLTESAVCLVAPDNGIDMHMQRVLKIHQKYQGGLKPVLEINTSHPLIKKLQILAENNGGSFNDTALLLLDQAKIIQGEPVNDTGEFARRMNTFMEKAL
jgi:molecular chaperone HtpG